MDLNILEVIISEPHFNVSVILLFTAYRNQCFFQPNEIMSKAVQLLNFMCCS